MRIEFEEKFTHKYRSEITGRMIEGKPVLNVKSPQTILDFFLSHFSTLLDEVISEIVPEEQDEPEKMNDFAEGFMYGFNCAIAQMKENYERFKK